MNPELESPPGSERSPFPSRISSMSPSPSLDRRSGRAPSSVGHRSVGGCSSREVSLLQRLQDCLDGDTGSAVGGRATGHRSRVMEAADRRRDKELQRQRMLRDKQAARQPKEASVRQSAELERLFRASARNKGSLQHRSVSDFVAPPTTGAIALGPAAAVGAGITQRPHPNVSASSRHGARGDKAQHSGNGLSATEASLRGLAATPGEQPAPPASSVSPNAGPVPAARPLFDDPNAAALQAELAHAKLHGDNLLRLDDIERFFATPSFVRPLTTVTVRRDHATAITRRSPSPGATWRETSEQEFRRAQRRVAGQAAAGAPRTAR